jgi:hypothetical protein
MEKQLRPATYCTNCGKVGYNIGLANERCRQMGDRKRCKGQNQSAIGINDWIECPACEGTGWTGNAASAVMEQAGFSFAASIGMPIDGRAGSPLIHGLGLSPVLLIENPIGFGKRLPSRLLLGLCLFAQHIELSMIVCKLSGLTIATRVV